MERKVVNKDYKARKVERAIEILIGSCLEKLSLKAMVSKFTHNESGTERELKWDIHLGSEDDAQRLEEILQIPQVDVIGCDDCLTVFLNWDIEGAEKQYITEKEIVSSIENTLGIKVLEGVEDVEILQGDYYWGNVENIIY